MPPREDIEPISKQLTIVIGLTVVGFMAFGLALSFYRNILFEKTLFDLEAENRKIAERIEKSYRDLEYGRSNQYKDKFAKENLGKILPGEQLIVITKAQTHPFDEEDDALERERREAEYQELLLQMPTLEHWKLYFFRRDEIEEFKRRL